MCVYSVGKIISFTLSAQDLWHLPETKTSFFQGVFRYLENLTCKKSKSCFAFLVACEQLTDSCFLGGTLFIFDRIENLVVHIARSKDFQPAKFQI